jgi:serine/threonine-protein kinase RsbW
MDDRIKIPCSKNSLKDIRIFVTETLKGLCVPELDISMLVLAVDEICANRIIHSNHNNENQYLELKIKKDEVNKISFEIMDEGAPFDHNSYPEANIGQLVKEKRKGGLGLMLVRKIMDSFEVQRENDMTVCRLSKKVNVC